MLKGDGREFFFFPYVEKGFTLFMVLWQMGLGCQVQIRWQIGGTP
jgi:hypothetical protein